MTGLWTKLVGAAGLATVLFSAVPAQAARDPDYQAARAAGRVGEMMDGYLGIVGASTPELQRIVREINIQRREKYLQGAAEARPRVTLEEFAITGGCLAILRTVPGEKYQSPQGWQTRTNAPPVRDPRCPPAG